jgi:transcriptional regulator with XRE-family HTH domain
MSIEDFWNRVRLLLRNSGRTQASAAAACNLRLNTLRGWMSKNIIPTVFDAYNIAAYLEVTLEYLITGKETDMGIQMEKTNLLLKNAEKKLGDIFHQLKNTANKKKTEKTKKAAPVESRENTVS